MNAGQPGTEKSLGMDGQHRLRLVALLDDLVGDNAASRSTEGLDLGHRILAASPENKRLTRRMRVALDDTKGKLSCQEMLHRLRRVLSLGMWRRWRQRARDDFQLAFVSSIE